MDDGFASCVFPVDVVRLIVARLVVGIGASRAAARCARSCRRVRSLIAVAWHARLTRIAPALRLAFALKLRSRLQVNPGFKYTPADHISATISDVVSKRQRLLGRRTSEMGHVRIEHIIACRIIVCELTTRCRRLVSLAVQHAKARRRWERPLPAEAAALSSRSESARVNLPHSQSVIMLVLYGMGLLHADEAQIPLPMPEQYARSLIALDWWHPHQP